MILSHKIQLRPTPRQVTYFSQACGVSRFTYNWALARYKAMLDKKEKPNLLALKREFNAIYHKEFPWVGDVLRDAHSQPFANLQNAVGKFFKKTAKFPVFKSKHGSKQNDREPSVRWQDHECPRVLCRRPLVREYLGCYRSRR
jgi:putative transposase